MLKKLGLAFGLMVFVFVVAIAAMLADAHPMVVFILVCASTVLACKIFDSR